MTTENSTSWPLPEMSKPFEAGPGRSQEDHETWKELVLKVHALADQAGWSKAETARRIGLPDGTFNSWYSGKYNGRFDTTNDKVSAWLASMEESAAIAATLPASPSFIRTRIAGEIMDMLTAAQVMPALVMATAEAGMGKTTTAKYFRDTRPHCHLVTVSPHTRTVHAMLMEIAETVGVRQQNPGRLTRSIGERLRRTGSGSLLIVDEAQNLVDEAINQLRHFVDIYDCGVAILGNTETYSRFAAATGDGVKYGQLRRRIFKRMRRDKPNHEDLAKFIRACGIADADQARFLTGVGMKPGAFGQIDMTVKLAKMLALGEQRDVTLQDLKAAWENRDVEGLS